MPYPNIAGKHAEAALFSPAEFMAYQRARGRLPEFPVPCGLIMLYRDALFDALAARPDAQIVASFAGRTLLLPGPSPDRPLAVCGGFGIGAPAAAAVLEEWIAYGVERVVSIGTAGSLQPDLPVGGLVVCDGAVRDEGVSHHYLPPDHPATPDPALTAALRRRLTQAASDVRTGRTWTIDTPFRETIMEIRAYQGQGVATVEMEAAALFAVAEHRRVAIAAAFAISDSLAEVVWSPRFGAPEVRDGLLALAGAAIATLVEEPSDREGPDATRTP